MKTTRYTLTATAGLVVTAAVVWLRWVLRDAHGRAVR